MKVYSLYYNDTFVVAFPIREDTIQFGKKHYDEYSWECNIIEEYLSKSPLTYTSPHSMPCDTGLDNTGITLLSGTPQTNPYNNGIKAKVEDYPVELVGEPGPEPHS